MFVSFSVAAFLFWAFIAAFLPGAIISFSLFRKGELNFIEKLLTGFAIGTVSLPLIPFLLYFVAGITFSYGVALLSVAVLYAIGIALFIRAKAYEGIMPALSGIRQAASGLKLPSSEAEFMKSLPALVPSLISLALILVLVLSYLVRIGSYSPVFQELDPYYYTYVASQILTYGYNPENDQTAWYPDLVVDHREIPEVSYLESVWYALYTGGAPYDNMLLALVASMYPPIAAVLSVFFIYLLVSVGSSRREWGVIAAGIASFIPVFIYKLAAGEQETQPYAFFALFFFYAMYALAVSRKDMRFAALAGLAFAAVSLGSSSQLLALASVMVFMVGQAALLYLRDEDAGGIRQLLATNAVVFAIGPLAGSAILRDVFSAGTPSLTVSGAFLLCMAFVGLLYVLKQRLSDRNTATTALAAIALAGLVLFAFTPLGTPIKNVARAGFEIAKYNAPLDRTIAEQGGASTTFDGQMGVIAAVFNLPDAQNVIVKMFGYALWALFMPFTLVSNALLSLSVAFMNLMLGTDVSIDAKANSAMFFWVIAFLCASVWAAWKSTKKEDTLAVFFLALVIPPFIVGIIKAKYTIYAAVVLAVAIGFSLGYLADFISALGAWLAKRGKEAAADLEAVRNTAVIITALIGAGLVMLQFFNAGFAPGLAAHALDPLYQNDPAALGPKFQKFCAATNDADICAAAADPLGYASNGTNYQYNYKLCAASVYSNVSYLSNPNAAPGEAQAAYFRCQRLSDYWVNSMEWLRDNTPNGSRIVSWWDYGHWINYFGERNAVIRNEHLSHQMIGEVAHAYVDGGPDVLKEYMKSHDIKYALFDMELISGGGQLGGKFGALNYLSCAHDNGTNVSRSPGESACEANHLWETIFVSNSPCTISQLSNKTGFTAYEIYEQTYAPAPDGRIRAAGEVYRPYYRPECESPADASTIAYCKNAVRAVPTYCVGPATLVNGQETYATYYLNETYPNGDLKLNKALLQLGYQLDNTYHFGPATGLTLFYTTDPIWLENGEAKSGYEDRKNSFYSSNLYRALFLNDIPGFRLAYATPDGAVKIYELEE